MTQYVHPCAPGLARIVKHGRGWRALLDEREVGRHDSVEAALLDLRTRWPKARLPGSVLLWRHLPEPRQLGRRRAHGKAPGNPVAGLRAFGG
ncbi:MAG TPA: hypothetical protein VFH59_07675 [Frateuria sp.]|uniref:hypothetical protein n=1 Tax=Frateuria sp. TaxID=2211372 RepID=UPI002D7E5EFE|nr:hypothetical protein [Frateuria sp.]HET6805300.1 hypothetical protein [Frateuria sp.]